MRRRQPQNPHDFNIPEKANRILNVILVVIILIILRVWYLAVVQHEVRDAEFRKPQRKTIVEPARRATIRDRFNIPMAINKVQYQATILYSQFRQIPTFSWIKDQNGKKIKVHKRKEYISALSKKLAKILKLEADRLEDLIYSKAAFYYNIPFVIKEEISEQEYYRLKMLEKDWLGVHVRRLPKRTYPLGKVGADIIGYLGAINRQEYEKIIHEMNALKEYLAALDAGEEPEYPFGLTSSNQVRKRLKELQEHAYTVNDYVGKTGIEGRFEETLRGFQGKKSYYSDAQGNFLRELPGSREPIPGTRLLLTISSELQEYAENLLIQNESVRETHPSHPNSSNPYPQKDPWIKGGAIVAMDPMNGDVLALATHPRFDPNDFIASGNPEISKVKNANIARWFETEQYIAQMWNQKRPLEREKYDPDQKAIIEDSTWITWERYLEFILPAKHPVVLALEQIKNIQTAANMQQAATALLHISGQESLYGLFQVLYHGENDISYGKRLTSSAKHQIEEKLHGHPQTKGYQAQLDRFFANVPHNYDKVLIIDLCRLVLDADRFSEALLRKIGKQTISEYKNCCDAIAVLEPVIKKMAKELYHHQHFKPWRLENEKEFLKQKRQEEKIALIRYPKPYLDYLDEKENQLFLEFWEQHRWNFLVHFLYGSKNQTSLSDPYLALFNTWQRQIAKGDHDSLDWIEDYKILQTHLQQVPKKYLTEYLGTLRSFHELNRPLLGKYTHLKKNKEGGQLEKHLASAFYPLYGYGYGRSYAFRQATTQGSLFKLVTAYSALKQRYKELEKGQKKITKKKLNPLVMVDSTHHKGSEVCMGYHEDGSSIPQHYKGGRLIKSHKISIGKLDIIRAIEESSNPYFSLIAGDFLNHPEDLNKNAQLFSYGKKTGIHLVAEVPGSLPKDLKENRTGVYAMAIGQHTLVVTPLQACVMVAAIANGGKVLEPKILHMTVGEDQKSNDNPFTLRENFPYQESLALVGIDFPLFTSPIRDIQTQAVKRAPTVVKRDLNTPPLIREIILDGMTNVISKIKHHGFSSLTNLYKNHPEAIQSYLEVEPSLIGKTSTAEVVEKIDMDILFGKDTFTHVWFGGISFDRNLQTSEQTYLFKDERGVPELVVIVYIKFGRFGREAAPVAAQVIKKWREIKKSHLEKNGA